MNAEASLWEPEPTLSATCHIALRKLAEIEDAEGAPVVAAHWRTLDQILEDSHPVASLELCARIVGVFVDLANTYRIRGWDGAERWSKAEQWLTTRMFARERHRIATGH